MATAYVFLVLAMVATSGLAHFPLFNPSGSYPAGAAGYGEEEQVQQPEEDTSSTNERVPFAPTGSQQGSTVGKPLLFKLLGFPNANSGYSSGYGRFYSVGGLINGYSANGFDVRKNQFSGPVRKNPDYKAFGASFQPFSPNNFYNTRRFVYPASINDFIGNQPFVSDEIISININLPETKCEDKVVKVSNTKNKITNVNKKTVENKEIQNQQQQEQNAAISKKQQKGNQNEDQELQNQQQQQQQQHQQQQPNEKQPKAGEQQKHKKENQDHEQQKQHNDKPQPQHFQRTSIKKNSESQKSSEENEENKKVKISHEAKHGKGGHVEKNRLSKDENAKSQKTDEHNKEQFEKKKLQIN